jgi:hypothetical protein
MVRDLSSDKTPSPSRISASRPVSVHFIKDYSRYPNIWADEKTAERLFSRRLGVKFMTGYGKIRIESRPDGGPG